MIARPTVLIVEDEYAIADLLELVLADEGYAAVKASNGRVALQRLVDSPLPDLMLCDFMMPVLDGPGLLAAMQLVPRQRAIPFIIMSSVPEATVSERVSGYAAFLDKPFRLAAVVTLVAAVLSGAGPSPKAVA